MNSDSSPLFFHSDFVSIWALNEAYRCDYPLTEWLHTLATDVYSMVMSVWGVIFLGLLGVFFYIQAVSLFPDLHFPEEEVEHGVVPPLTNA